MAASKRAKPTRKKVKPVLLSISAVARALGVSPSTLRMWENLGLVTPKRTASGYRQFTPQQVESLKEVNRIKSSKGVSSRVVVHLLNERPAKGVGPEKPQASIGSRLRALRDKKGITLREAAQQASLSLNFLDAIEKERMSASVATLQKLSQIYGSTVLSLFGQQETPQKLIRPSERRSLESAPGVVIESLAASQSSMEPHLFRVSPGASSGGGYTHEGEEFLYVLSGNFQVCLDERETYDLAAGDSLYFSSKQAHSWSNTGSEEAVVLWLNTPATF